MLEWPSNPPMCLKRPDSQYLALEIQKEECGRHGDGDMYQDDCSARRNGGEEGQLEGRIRGLARRPGRDEDQRRCWHTRTKLRIV